jgi:hypothetical protein
LLTELFDILEHVISPWQLLPLYSLLKHAFGLRRVGVEETQSHLDAVLYFLYPPLVLRLLTHQSVLDLLQKVLPDFRSREELQLFLPIELLLAFGRVADGQG